MEMKIEGRHAPCLITTSCDLVRDEGDTPVGVLCPMCGRSLLFVHGEPLEGEFVSIYCPGGHWVCPWFGESGDGADGEHWDGDDGTQTLRVVQYKGVEITQGDACEPVRNNWGALIGVRCPQCGTAAIIAKDRMHDPNRDRARDQLEADEGREEAERWASSTPAVLECRGCHSLIATYGWMR